MYGDSQDGLQIYSSADNFVVFTGYFRASDTAQLIENRGERLYNPATKTKT